MITPGCAALHPGLYSFTPDMVFDVIHNWTERPFRRQWSPVVRHSAADRLEVVEKVTALPNPPASSDTIVPMEQTRLLTTPNYGHGLSPLSPRGFPADHRAAAEPLPKARSPRRISPRRNLALAGPAEPGLPRLGGPLAGLLTADYFLSSSLTCSLADWRTCPFAHSPLTASNFLRGVPRIRQKCH